MVLSVVKIQSIIYLHMYSDSVRALILSLTLLVLVVACSSSKEFTGYSYDPEGVTNTVDKETLPQYKRTIGVDSGTVWVTNEFAGARMSDFYQVNDSLYRLVVNPENREINNSPWYAFKIWDTSLPDSAKNSITLELDYNYGDHRYIPKLSTDGKNWSRIDSTNIQNDTTSGTASLTLDLNSEPLWVSAQELITQQDYSRWMDSLATKPWVSLDTVGFSHERNPIVRMKISEAADSSPKGVVIITGRQHPPEVTGALAAEVFINELTSDTKLASKFRNEFEVWSYPLVNPDGVQNGHWRHNARGIDLNRDWQHFNQPEPRAIRDDLLKLKNDSLKKVYYGIDFHSTNENIFYPINREISTFPEDFTYQWIDSLKQRFPNYAVEVEPFAPNSPITKNWIYHTFGADAVTYEINDQANRDSIRTVVGENARIIMRQLLEVKQRQ